MSYKHHLIHNFCSVNPIATNLYSMESYEHVEHFRMKKHQSCYVHKLGAFKFIQNTTLIITWILKMIFKWNQLQ
jgi:hypothetical protein